jgi:hypothetical protein
MPHQPINGQLTKHSTTTWMTSPSLMIWPFICPSCNNALRSVGSLWLVST